MFGLLTLKSLNLIGIFPSLPIFPSKCPCCFDSNPTFPRTLAFTSKIDRVLYFQWASLVCFYLHEFYNHTSTFPVLIWKELADSNCKFQGLTVCVAIFFLNQKDRMPLCTKKGVSVLKTVFPLPLFNLSCCLAAASWLTVLLALTNSALS